MGAEYISGKIVEGKAAAPERLQNPYF